MDVDVAVLQERCRKDPESYRAEYLAQHNHFLALLASATLRPSEASSRLPDMASFVASTAPLFGTKVAAEIADPIVELLSLSAPALEPNIRRSLVRTLALLRARGVVESSVVIPLFFRLLGCEDKQLRRMLQGHIVSDVKRMQASGDTAKRGLQAYLYGIVEEPNEVLVKRSMHVLVDLFRRRIWNDARTANVVGSCVFHESMPVAMVAANFLLDSESKSGDGDENSGSEDDEDDLENKYNRRGRDGKKASDMWKAYNLTGKKSTKKKKAMERTISRVTRVKRTAGSRGLDDRHGSFAAMMLLNDPQSFAERLYSDLQTRRRSTPYEHRLVLINLLTRLVGTYKLLVLNLYPFLQRYLQPAQSEVTRVLAYLVQACHDLVPPDVLHPTLRLIADNFVSDRCSPPAMAAGLNTIRAICARVPLAIFDEENEAKPDDEQEAPLLEDLVQYKSSRDKGVVMAARSLVMLYRDINPRLLHKRDRGRAGAEAVQKGTAAPAPAYGMLNFATCVEGVELLREDTDEDSVDDEDDGHSNADAEEIGRGEREPKRLDKTNDGIVEEEEVHEDSSASEKGITDDADVDAESDSDPPHEAFENTCPRTGVSRGSRTGRDREGDDPAECEPAADAHRATASAQNSTAELDSMDEDNAETVPDAQALRPDMERILTDEDYARIRARRAARLVEGSRTRQRPGVDADTGEAVEPSDIQGYVKRERRTLEERMESVLAGREGREKFGSRKGFNKGGGSSNKAKLKSKANSMVIHKQRKKNKLSRRERQAMKTKKRAYK